MLERLKKITTHVLVIRDLDCGGNYLDLHKDQLCVFTNCHLLFNGLYSDLVGWYFVLYAQPDRQFNHQS